MVILRPIWSVSYTHLAMAYEMMKKVITRGQYNKELTVRKLNAYLAVDELTPEQYQELMNLVNQTGQPYTE